MVDSTTVAATTLDLGDHDCHEYEWGTQLITVKHAYIHPRYWLSEAIAGDPLGSIAVFDIAMIIIGKLNLLTYIRKKSFIIFQRWL